MTQECCDNPEIIVQEVGEIWYGLGGIYDTRELITFCKNCCKLIDEEEVEQTDEIPY